MTFNVQSDIISIDTYKLVRVIVNVIERQELWQFLTMVYGKC